MMQPLAASFADHAGTALGAGLAALAARWLLG